MISHEVCLRIKPIAYFVTERVPGSSGWGWSSVRNDIIVFRKEKLNILKVAWKPCCTVCFASYWWILNTVKLMLFRTNAIGFLMLIIEAIDLFIILDHVRCIKHKNTFWSSWVNFSFLCFCESVTRATNYRLTRDSPTHKNWKKKIQN